MRIRLSCALVAFASLLVARGPSRADDRRAQIVVTVGPRSITVGELEDRMQAIPRFQLATFGDTAVAIKTKFLNEVVLPEVLLTLGAEAQKLDQTLPTSYALERALSSATMNAVREQTGSPSSIAAADVQKYYDDNRAHYDAPERYSLWRIECKTRDEAVEVLEDAKKDGTPKTFEALARDHSLDKGTYLRGGNLGFIAPDGTSNEAGLRVEPALYLAAASVKDGEIVPQPVSEGSSFSVVWRRGTLGASHRSIDDAAPQIRDTLWKQRTEQAQKKLIDDLRARDLKDLHEDLLDNVDMAAKDSAIVPRKRPGQVAPLTPVASSSGTPR